MVLANAAANAWAVVACKPVLRCTVLACCISQHGRKCSGQPQLPVQHDMQCKPSKLCAVAWQPEELLQSQSTHAMLAGLPEAPKALSCAGSAARAANAPQIQ